MLKFQEYTKCTDANKNDSIEKIINDNINGRIINYTAYLYSRGKRTTIEDRNMTPY